jgi:hypothetical protein
MTRSARRRSSSLASSSSSAPWSASTYSRRCTDRSRSARAWRSTDDHAEGEDAAAEQQHEAEHDPARVLQLGLRPPLEVAAQGRVWVRRRSISVLRVRGSGDAGRLRPGALHLADGDARVRLPFAGGGRERADLREGRAIALAASDGPVVRALELVSPSS